MGKIMQIINKKTNFTDGTVDLKLYQTGFAGLTKVLGNVAGQTVSNAVSEAYTGYQFFHNLNDLQLDMKPKLESVGTAYNIDINNKKSKVPALYNFSYNFNSIVNYKSGITEGTKVDYKLLQLIVNPEKEMYDYKVFMSEHVKRNAEILKEWSKTRPYGSNASTVTSDRLRLSDGMASIWKIEAKSNNTGTSIINSFSGREFTIGLSNPQTIPTGATRTFTVRVHYYDYQDTPYTVDVNFSITRHQLGASNDDGYFTKVNFTNSNTGVVSVASSNGGASLKGLVSPYFTTSTHDFKWFKTRNLI